MSLVRIAPAGGEVNSWSTRANRLLGNELERVPVFDTRTTGAAATRGEAAERSSGSDLD